MPGTYTMLRYYDTSMRATCMCALHMHARHAERICVACISAKHVNLLHTQTGDIQPVMRKAGRFKVRTSYLHICMIRWWLYQNPTHIVVLTHIFIQLLTINYVHTINLAIWCWDNLFPLQSWQVWLKGWQVWLKRWQVWSKGWQAWLKGWQAWLKVWQVWLKGWQVWLKGWEIWQTWR